MLIKCSINSIRGFIKLFLGIKSTPYWFHQVLTFNINITDGLIAKKYLKQLLDSLEKAYPDMAAFFIQGIQKKGRIHYHIIFMFWGERAESPEKMRVSFGRDVFSRWKKITGVSAEKENALFRNANRTILREKNYKCIEYLLQKHVFPSESVSRSKSNWHGIRNRKLIQANAVPFTKKQVKEMYNDIYPNLNRGLQGRPIRIKEELPPKFTMRDLKKSKAFHEDHARITGSGHAWDDFKKWEMKSDKNVSDAAYLRFKNRPKAEIPNKYESKDELPF